MKRRALAAAVVALSLSGCDYPGTWQDDAGTHWVQIHAEWELELIPTLRVWDVPPTVRVDLIMDEDIIRPHHFTQQFRCEVEYRGTYRYYPKTKQTMCEGIQL